MTQEKVSPLREWMMEDMRIRGMGDKSQKAHIRALKDFTAFLGRSPDTAPTLQSQMICALISCTWQTQASPHQHSMPGSWRSGSSSQ